MSEQERKMTAILREVPPDWREDFVRLVEGETPGEEFEAYFESNTECRRLLDEVLRVLDEGLIPLFREAVSKRLVT